MLLLLHVKLLRHLLLLLIPRRRYDFWFVAYFIHTLCHIVQFSFEIVNANAISDEYLFWYKSFICRCGWFAIFLRLHTFRFIIHHPSSRMKKRWLTARSNTRFDWCIIAIHEHTILVLIKNLPCICLIWLEEVKSSIFFGVAAVLLSKFIDAWDVFLVVDFLFFVWFTFSDGYCGIVVTTWVYLALGHSICWDVVWGAGLWLWMLCCINLVPIGWMSMMLVPLVICHRIISLIPLCLRISFTLISAAFNWILVVVSEWLIWW